MGYLMPKIQQGQPGKLGFSYKPLPGGVCVCVCPHTRHSVIPLRMLGQLSAHLPKHATPQFLRPPVFRLVRLFRGSPVLAGVFFCLPTPRAAEAARHHLGHHLGHHRVTRPPRAKSRADRFCPRCFSVGGCRVLRGWGWFCIRRGTVPSFPSENQQ